MEMTGRGCESEAKVRHGSEDGSLAPSNRIKIAWSERRASLLVGTSPQPASAVDQGELDGCSVHPSRPHDAPGADAKTRLA
jgi:hypothetical protein